MARREIGTSWDRENRNNINENFKELYDVQNRAIEEATQAVIDSAKLLWLEPVNTYADIATTYPSPEVGHTVFVRDTGKVYRFYDGSWMEIQQIDAGPVNEVDTRLSAEIEENKYRLDDVDVRLAQKASGAVFRYTVGGTPGSEQVINIIEGYTGNGVASDLRGCTISGGGGVGYENVIGSADTANVGTTTPKTPNLTGTNAHYAVIGGGYDNVNNALAGVLTGYHCVIESAATHGTISGGSYHKIIDGDYSTISGGTLNEINVADSGGGYGTIGGGSANKVTGKFATIAGGYSNQANGERSMVLGGSNNISSGYGSSISGGFNNTASGNQSTVTGGQSNTASGSGASVFNGRNNVASGQDSIVLGGAYNEATAQESIVTGLYGKSTNRGQMVTGGGKFSVTGDAQESKYVLRRQTTDATTKNLGINNADIVPSISDNGAWLFTAKVVAKSGSDIKAWKVEGIFYKNGTNNAAFLGTPTVTTVGATAGANSWSVGTLAGSSTLNIRITGEEGKVINWVAKLETVEVIA